MKIKIRDALIFLNTVFIIITAGVIIAMYSASTKLSVYSISDRFMKETLTSVVNKTGSYLLPVEKANSDIAYHYRNLNLGNFLTDSGAALNYFKEMMTVNPEFVMVYFADEKGNLVMQRRMPDNSFSKRYIMRDANAVRIVYDHTNADYYATYPNSAESLETGYDPRDRIWYKTALQKKNTNWTDVYVFATGNIPGFSCSTPIYYPDGKLMGVSCIDIGVRELSLFLGTISLTPNARLFIMDAKNQIIAEPIRADEPLDKLFVVTTINGQESRVLHTIEELDDAALPASLKAYEKQEDKNASFMFRYGENRYFSMYSGIYSDRGLNFKVGIVIPDQDIMGIMYRNNKIMLAVSSIFIVLVSLISIFISTIISKPLNVLSVEMIRMKYFALEDSKPIKSIINEIDKMVESFEGMKRGLGNFKKYVPAELVTELIQRDQEAKLGGERRELTVFFSDVADFTHISEALPPEQLVDQIYEYFNLLTNTILEMNGTIDKYMGDAVMAFWGAPAVLADHAVSACRSALLCQELIQNLSRKWQREGKPVFKTRMGLNTGSVLVGNVGCDKRINYTVLGDAVNLASRLEGINKFYGTEIVVSEATYGQTRDFFEFRKLDRIMVKGKQQPIHIYELLSEKGKLNKNMMKRNEIYEKSLAYYFAGDWKNAIRGMDCILKAMSDTAALEIKKRAAYYLENPPAAWNGVHEFNQK